MRISPLCRALRTPDARDDERIVLTNDRDIRALGIRYSHFNQQFLILEDHVEWRCE